MSYSENPDSVTCGSIQVLLATTSLNPTQRLIHIDSGSALFHLRYATDEEFKDWTMAILIVTLRHLTSDDEDYSDNKNVIFSDDSYTSSTTDEEEEEVGKFF